jgi:hypothetical protein
LASLMRMGTATGLVQRRGTRSSIHKGLGEFLPTSVQKSYFMLSDAERDVLNSALEKYRTGQAELILVGGEKPRRGCVVASSISRLSTGPHATRGFRCPLGRVSSRRPRTRVSHGGTSEATGNDRLMCFPPAAFHRSMCLRKPT